MHSLASQHNTWPSNIIPAPPEHPPSARASPYFASGGLTPPHPPAGPNRMRGNKASKAKPGKSLSKSLSTPQLRRLSMSESDLDKKRNKLGYQRISIACAHCRRRKIRCLPTEDDAEQRCQNCIRLKKECVFYPVDQQHTAMDARSEASSRTGAPSATSSTLSLSPSQVGSRSIEPQTHQFGGGFQNISSDISGGYPAIPIITIPSQGNYATRDSQYLSTGENSPWSSEEFETPNEVTLDAPRTNMHPSFATYGNPRMATDATPYPGSLAHHAGDFTYPSEQQHWLQQQPVRSMSFPEFPNGYNTSYLSTQQPPGPYVQQQPFHPPQSDPRIVPASPYHGAFPVQQHAYTMTPDQRSSSLPHLAPYQQPPQYPPNWYSVGPSRPTAAEVKNRAPSKSDSGAYPVRTDAG